MNKLLSIALFTVLCTPLVATAQSQRKPAARPAATHSAKKPAKAKRPVAPAKPTKRTKRYDFEGDNIDGASLGPDGTRILVRPPTLHTSLVRLRSHFVPEVTRSAEDL